jgi:plastocyanin
MNMSTRVVTIGAALLFAAGLALPEKTVDAGTLTGKVVVSGTKLKTEGGKSDKDVVVYLERADGGDYPAPTDADAVEIDQVGSVFIPHVLPVQKGTKVTFKNSDSFEHNVFSADDCCGMDLGNFAGGQAADHVFDTTGEGVMLCKLHPEMAAYVIVLDTAYFTRAELDGAIQSATYRIDDIPPGDYVLKAWNKKTQSAEQTVTISDDTEATADVTLEKKQRKRRKRKK